MSNTLEAEPVLAFGHRKPGTRRRYTAEQKKMILEEARRPGKARVAEPTEGNPLPVAIRSPVVEPAGMSRWG